MLQIASGMYFPNSEVWETTHRRTFYSNAIRGQGDDIELPIGTLRFSNGRGAVQPVLIEAVDRLPKKNPDGSDSMHIATGGDELVDDVADVIAFVFNAVVGADIDLVHRTVEGRQQGGRRPSKQLRQITEGARQISDAEVAHAAQFCASLLALERKPFEAAMRAIRRLADAVALSATDVTLAYTLFVAALESLSGDTTVPQLEWDQYDKQKRQLVDQAIAGLPEDRVGVIRDSVLEIDSFRIARRFQQFVLEHISDEYYGAEAVGAERAVRSVDLPKALDFAYGIRSKAMHELRDLAPELWAIVGVEETIWHNNQTVLTLEGLHRLSQHVVREYVRRARTGVDPEFQRAWRDSIPGIIKVQLAPQYWLAMEPGMDRAAGRRMFAGLVDSIVSVLHEETPGVVDLAATLERIELRLETETDARTRLEFAATYALWHGFMHPDFHRERLTAMEASYGNLFSAPSIYSYVVALFSGTSPNLSDADVLYIADSRKEDLLRSRKTLLRLPRDVDGALAVDAALRAHRVGAPDAAARISVALELLPGDWRVRDIIARIEAGDQPDVDPRGFIAAKDE